MAYSPVIGITPDSQTSPSSKTYYVAKGDIPTIQIGFNAFNGINYQMGWIITSASIGGVTWNTIANGLYYATNSSGTLVSVSPTRMYSLKASSALTTAGTYTFSSSIRSGCQIASQIEGKANYGYYTRDITVVVQSRYYYNVKFDGNGATTNVPGNKYGTTVASSKPGNATVAIPSTTPVYPTTDANKMYKFVGWSKTKYTPGTGTASYTAGSSYGSLAPYVETTNYQDKGADTPTLTLYAVWERIYYSKLKYNLQDGATGAPTPNPNATTQSTSTGAAPADRSVTIPNVTPTLTNSKLYKFVGWSTTNYTTIGEGTATYPIGSTVKVGWKTNNTDIAVNLYSVWESLVYYYDGSGWVKGKKLYGYDGSSWVEAKDVEQY